MMCSQVLCTSLKQHHDHTGAFVNALHTSEATPQSQRSIWTCSAQVQGGGTGGLSFFDTIYKAAMWPLEAPHQDMSAAIVASPNMSPGQGGLVTTVSDLHHDHHTARPELYVPKVGS